VEDGPATGRADRPTHAVRDATVDVQLALRRLVAAERDAGWSELEQSQHRRRPMLGGGEQRRVAAHVLGRSVRTVTP